MISYKVEFERSYDVLVVGGGITGCCAALASARNGAKTAIVEMSGFLGGVAAFVSKFPWNGFVNYLEKQYVVKGIPLEIVTRLRKEGAASEEHLDPIMESLTDVEGPMLRIVLSEMMNEAGVDVYYHSIASMPLVEDKQIKGVYIQNKQGCELLKCKILVDATESADMAVKAGSDYVYGQEGTGKTQIASTAMVLGNIDMDKLITCIEMDPVHVRPRTFSPTELEYVIRSLRESPLSCIGTFREQIKKAKEDGFPMPERDIISGTIYPQSRQLVSVASKVIGVNPRDVTSISKAETIAYSQVMTLYRFFKKYVPGCSDATLQDVSTHIGIRETLHIIGEYHLSSQDLIDGVIFEDAIATGSYIMDVHSPDHGSVEPCVELPTYSIPYRSLVPKKIDGVVVAGRCISASHEAMSAFRVIPIVGAIGEGAGTAAALCCKEKCQPRYLDPKLLRDTLIKNKCEIGQDRIKN